MTEQEYLQSYQKEQYELLSVTTDVLIFSISEEFSLTIYLLRRNQYPQKGRLSLPGGFVSPEKDLDETAASVLLAKTGLKLIPEQLYTFGRPDRDPRMRIITVAYFAILPQGYVFQQTAPKDSAMLPVSEVLRAGDGMAFDHADIIRTALERIRGRMEYTDTAFRFLKNRNSFTLYELRMVFEAVMGKSYEPSNFRRFVSRHFRTEETGASGNDFSKKPSKYYRFCPDEPNGEKQ